MHFEHEKLNEDSTHKNQQESNKSGIMTAAVLAGIFGYGVGVYNQDGNTEQSEATSVQIEMVHPKDRTISGTTIETFTNQLNSLSFEDLQRIHTTPAGPVRFASAPDGTWIISIDGQDFAYRHTNDSINIATGTNFITNPNELISKSNVTYTFDSTEGEYEITKANMQDPNESPIRGIGLATMAINWIITHQK